MLTIIALTKTWDLGQALNAGLNACQHDWVIRMDTDDICVPNRFWTTNQLYPKPSQIDVLGANHWIWKTAVTGEKSRTVPTSHEAIFASAKSRNPINHMTVGL